MRKFTAQYPLELDGYNANKGLAFEYNGPRHYFIKNWDLYSKQQTIKVKRNDVLKRKGCRKLGIKLVTIPFWIKDIDKYIRSRCHALS